MKNISILLILLSFITCSCSLPLFPDDEPELQPYLQDTSLGGNEYYTIQRMPPSFDGEEVLKEVTSTGKALRQWLHIPPPATPVSIILFSPQEQDGKHFLQKSRTRHQATGHYNRVNRILCVTGQVTDPRFRLILRHEAAHAALYDALPSDIEIPFWLNEGIASIFEQGADALLKPNLKNERLQLLHYMLARGEKLQIKKLIEKPAPQFNPGTAYAISWGLVAYISLGERPVSCYLHGLSQESLSPQKLFTTCLLASDESFETFEANCTKWLLSQ